MQKPEVIESEPHSYEAFDIQLISVQTMEMSVRLLGPTSESSTAESGDFAFSFAHSEFDPEERKIGVKVSCEISEQEETPISLKVTLVGIFEVDDTNFEMTELLNWVEKQGPLVLYPYLREHVFTLTARVGHEVLLPLFQVSRSNALRGS